MQHSPTVHLNVGVDIIQELSVSDSGSILLHAEINARGDTLGEAEPVPLEDLLEELHEGLKSDGEYQRLYVAAHELRRLSEEMYCDALQMERGIDTIAGHYGVDPDQLELDLDGGLPDDDG